MSSQLDLRQAKTMEEGKMNDKLLYVGVDNGVSGSLAAVNEEGSWSQTTETPVFSEQDYVLKKRNVTRIDVMKVRNWMVALPASGSRVHVIMERPMINPIRFRATMSAIRAWEAFLISLEGFNFPRITIDSKRWQKEMLPGGCKGPELKKASMQVGCRLFPDHGDWIRDHKDADGLLIAEFARRNKL